MGTWGFPGVYEGAPGFVLTLIQHNWSKDLNTKAWGLKPAQATVSRLSKLTTNYWAIAYSEPEPLTLIDNCSKENKEENVQKIKGC